MEHDFSCCCCFCWKQCIHAFLCYFDSEVLALDVSAQAATSCAVVVVSCRNTSTYCYKCVHAVRAQMLLQIIHTHACTCMQAHMHMCTQIHTHVCVRTCVHTRTHTHTHTQRVSLSLSFSLFPFSLFLSHTFMYKYILTHSSWYPVQHIVTSPLFFLAFAVYTIKATREINDVVFSSSCLQP